MILYTFTENREMHSKNGEEKRIHRPVETQESKAGVSAHSQRMEKAVLAGRAERPPLDSFWSGEGILYHADFAQLLPACTLQYLHFNSLTLGLPLNVWCYYCIAFSY
jgi:hypothetical protein